MLPVCLGEAAIAFGKIRCNRDRCPVQLVNQEAVSPRESLRASTHAISKVHRFLVDIELLEHEWHDGVLLSS